MKPDEMRRINEAFLKEHDPRWCALFPLLLHTGARLSEVLFAEWQQVDFEQRLFYLPITKGGEPHTIPLAEAAIAILARCRAA